LLGAASAQAVDTPPNPVFWERAFKMNTTTSTPRNVGSIIQSTSNIVTSQDFQGIHVDSRARETPEVLIAMTLFFFSFLLM
jgi:hypothetical protein